METTNILKNRHFIGIALCFFTLTASAQLKVSSDGKVGIGPAPSTLYSRLVIGNNQYGSGVSNIGITASPLVTDSKNNVGILGVVSTSSNYTSEKNYGVLGIVHEMNTSHGRNYGISGMIGPLTNSGFYGGAGVYGTNYTYFFSSPTNIQGAYAGYFDGPVHATGNMTVSNLFIPTDSRLNENVISLNDRGDQGTGTLESLLNMNVIEYNMKSRLSEEYPQVDDSENAEEVRAAYEYLKKDEQKMSSRRHFGIAAEELQEIYPDLVLVGQDGYLSVNYVEMVPLLIRSIQELKAEIDELKGTGTKFGYQTSGQTGESVNAQQPQIYYPITVDGKVIGTKKKNLSR